MSETPGHLPVNETVGDDPVAPKLVPWWLRGIYVVIGLGFVGLGLLGVYLPGLPTTPFLLLASYFLIRSSPKLYARVEAMPVVGSYLRDWNRKRGVRLHVKVLALVMTASFVGLGLVLGSQQFWVQVLVIALAAVGQAVVWSLKTVRD